MQVVLQPSQRLHELDLVECMRITGDHVEPGEGTLDARPQLAQLLGVPLPGSGRRRHLSDRID
jgi:hypothetical protein